MGERARARLDDTRVAQRDMSSNSIAMDAGRPGRQWLRRAFLRVDESYRQRCGLAAVGPLLYLGLERHSGAPLQLGDGTRVETGAWIGRLHFNNARAAAVEADSRLQAGVRFVRLLSDSFAELAERARADLGALDVAVFEGITWLRPHGSTAGFDAEPLAPGLRRWLLGAHFRLLIWAFAPVARHSAVFEVQPHRFRITRRALIEKFGSRRGAERLARARTS
jgi:hypothetical protein